MAGLLAQATPANAGTAAINTGIQVGFTDRALMDHVLTATDPPPSCNSKALTVRFHAAASLGDCDLVEPGGDNWGVSYVDPAYGYVTAPCFSYTPATDCDPYETPRAEWEPISFTCVPLCNSAAREATAIARWDPNTGGARGTLQVKHHAGPANDTNFIQVDVTFTNPSSTQWMRDIHYRRVTAFVGDLFTPPGPSCAGGACEARGTYSRLTLDGIPGPPPSGLVCSSNGSWTGAAPQAADCLFRFPTAQSNNGQTFCADDGAPMAVPVPGPGTTTAPPLGDWSVFPSPYRACAQGSLWEFDIGDLAPGASRGFRMYVGAVRGDAAAAVALLTAPGMEADFWAIGEPDTLSPRDTWASVVIAFRGFHPPQPEFSWTTPTPAWASWLPSPYQPGVTVCLGEAATFADTLTLGSWPALTRTWRWGDGTTSSGAGPVDHTFLATGTYHVQLDVVDDHGFTGSSQHDVMIMECPEPELPNVCPTVNAIQGAILFPGEVLRVILVTSDGDRDWRGAATPDSLTPSFTMDPPGGAVFDATTGELTWATRDLDAGTHTLRFDVRDEACTTTISFPVKVIARLPASLDQDQDGTADEQDNCPAQPNRNQADADRDGQGDACDTKVTGRVLPAQAPVRLLPDDFDGDGVIDALDRCLEVPNADQGDLDADGLGDSCDVDMDGDGIVDVAGEAFPDDCPGVPDPDQVDTDVDGLGDACDDETTRPHARLPPTDNPSANAIGRDAVVPGLELVLPCLALAIAASRSRRRT